MNRPVLVFSVDQIRRLLAEEQDFSADNFAALGRRVTLKEVMPLNANGFVVGDFYLPALGFLLFLLPVVLMTENDFDLSNPKRRYPKSRAKYYSTGLGRFFAEADSSEEIPEHIAHFRKKQNGKRLGFASARLLFRIWTSVWEVPANK